MSGHGGGGGGFGGSAGGMEPDCENINFVVQLSSLVEESVAEIEPGLELPVISEDGRVLVRRPGEVTELVGAINWAHNHVLIRCMEDGTRYLATVVAVDDGFVQVRVRAAL